MAANKLSDSDMSELLSPPKNPRGYKPMNFDPELEVFKGVINNDTEGQTLKTLQSKCVRMHKDMKTLLKKIERRHYLESKRDKLDSKLRQIDKEIEELHATLSEKY